MRNYHLSYDIIDSSKKITIYNKEISDSRQYILGILIGMGAEKVKTPCESTIVFTYKDYNFDFKSLYKCLYNFFYFTVCLVETKDINKQIELISFEQKDPDGLYKEEQMEKNNLLQDEWNNLLLKKEEYTKLVENILKSN